MRKHPWPAIPPRSNTPATCRSSPAIISATPDSFHGHSYPADELPGRAGQLVTSYTTGDNDVDLSLETALLLFSTQTETALADEPRLSGDQATRRPANRCHRSAGM
ncbi:hypothetical protein F1D05_10450 [Kribbella qitaiheensis]|uniref:Uncharacterized protein n=1 Tax=Kribbella qitaiheensis TaxID=1544730 RepID=A0A7G6WW75_9ACTN|nr:hypothetical protein [Kribbella qitaiheensis]QNE18240.1 hypothetical protein F1D05_10450 [Kribbella qitaiheensis]